MCVLLCYIFFGAEYYSSIFSAWAVVRGDILSIYECWAYNESPHPILPYLYNIKYSSLSLCDDRIYSPLFSYNGVVLFTVLDYLACTSSHSKKAHEKRKKERGVVHVCASCWFVRLGRLWALSLYGSSFVPEAVKGSVSWRRRGIFEVTSFRRVVCNRPRHDYLSDWRRSLEVIGSGPKNRGDDFSERNASIMFSNPDFLDCVCTMKNEVSRLYQRKRNDSNDDFHFLYFPLSLCKV